MTQSTTDSATAEGPTNCGANRVGEVMPVSHPQARFADGAYSKRKKESFLGLYEVIRKMEMQIP